MSWPWNWWRQSPNVQQQMDIQGKGQASTSIDTPTFQRVEPVVRQHGQSRVIQGVIGNTPYTIYQSGSNNPKKRSVEGVQTKSQRNKRAKHSDDVALKQARSGPVDERYLAVRKQRCSPAFNQDATSTKRARPDPVDDNVGFPTCAENDARKVPQKQMPTPEPISLLHLTAEELNSRSITGGHESIRVDSDFDQTSLEGQISTLAATQGLLEHDVAEITDPATLNSGEHIDFTEMPISVNVLQRRLARIKLNIERTACVVHDLQSDSIKLPCPSGRLIGIGLWPGSNHIPGQVRVCHDADAIELPTRRPRPLHKNSVVIVPASKAKHYLERNSVNTLQLPHLYKTKESKSRREKVVSSHRRLGGICNQSERSPMGPRTWTE